MHTHVAKNGTRIFYNSDFSGMAIILGAQYGEVEVPAADVRVLIEGEAILREIATSDPLYSDYSPKLVRACRYCGLALVSEHYEFPPFRRVHADDCLWLRAKRLVGSA